MPRSPLQFWHLLVIVLLAAMLGTAIGDLAGKAFPDSGVGRVLSAGVTLGSAVPWTLDLRVVTLTAGVVLRLSILGGIAAAAALVLFFRRL
jgi:hypothetical protein